MTAMTTDTRVRLDSAEHHTMAYIEKFDPDQVKYAIKKAELPVSKGKAYRKPLLRAYAWCNPDFVRYDSRESGLLEPKGKFLRQFVEPERLVVENNAMTTQGLAQMT